MGRLNQGSNTAQLFFSLQLRVIDGKNLIPGSDILDKRYSKEQQRAQKGPPSVMRNAQGAGHGTSPLNSSVMLRPLRQRTKGYPPLYTDA